MEVSEGALQLESKFGELGLQSRQTGLVDIVDMRWNAEKANLADEFKSLYISRLDQLEKRLDQVKITPISSLSDKGTYSIRGVVKRLEFNRVRAFERNFHQKYDNDNPVYQDLDEFQIEDKTGKIKFFFSNQTIHHIPGYGLIRHVDLPSGICLTLTGKYKKYANTFNVTEVIIPQILPQLKFNSNFINNDGVSFKNKKMLVVSEPTFQTCNKIQNILNAFCWESLNICALVIIGGIKMTTEDIVHMSRFLDEVKNSIDVFLMPSSGNQRHHLFPLRPYNGLYFLRSQEQIGLCSNPQLFQCENGLTIHISCGENVKDFKKNSPMPKSQIQVLELMLRFNHYCPTAPFSLKTESFNEDYLVIDQLPNIMVSGKSKDFQVKRVDFKQSKEVLLVTIPLNRMALVGLNGDFCKELL